MRPILRCHTSCPATSTRSGVETRIAEAGAVAKVLGLRAGTSRPAADRAGQGARDRVRGPRRHRVGEQGAANLFSAVVARLHAGIGGGDRALDVAVAVSIGRVTVTAEAVATAARAQRPSAP